MDDWEATWDARLAAGVVGAGLGRVERGASSHFGGGLLHV